MTDYHINVFFSDEDGCWVADIPDLRHCSAMGKTPEDAVREVMIARDLWLESAKARNKRIPVPTYRPTARRKASA